MDGIIILNKPQGKTSHDMVSFVRRLTGIRRVGHTGTLDPGATGVLPVCIGIATKAAGYITAGDKSYRAQMVLGSSTDTQDGYGTVLQKHRIDVTEKQIIDVTKRFTGPLEQIPPMYSAVKIEGKKLYQLAREGKQVERKSREIEIYKIEIIDIDLAAGVAVLDIDCTKGTYIRTLINDMGKTLGCFAHMGELLRTKSGGFTLEQSHTPEALAAMAQDSRLKDALIAVDTVFGDYGAVCVSPQDEAKIRNGVPISLDGVKEGMRYRVYGQNKDFLCLSEGKEGRLVMRTSFWQR